MPKRYRRYRMDKYRAVGGLFRITLKDIESLRQDLHDLRIELAQLRMDWAHYGR